MNHLILCSKKLMDIILLYTLMYVPSNSEHVSTRHASFSHSIRRVYHKMVQLSHQIFDQTSFSTPNLKKINKNDLDYRIMKVPKQVFLGSTINIISHQILDPTPSLAAKSYFDPFEWANSTSLIKLNTVSKKGLLGCRFQKFNQVFGSNPI